MSHGNGARIADARQLLVERIAASRYINRSARLRDLLTYLTHRAVEEEAGQIHEQEVGHQVFGRPADYDTAADNIVRVHASMLRKRLDQYFASEGVNEPLILEIPKGNYAPVFRERDEPAAARVLPPAPGRSRELRTWFLAGLVFLFASSTAYLLFRPAVAAKVPAVSARPTVRLFWSQVFQPGRLTDIVLDDAAVGLYQELSGRPLTLSSYFDRTYLRSLPETAAAANLDRHTAAAIVLRRQSSVSGASFVWKLLQTTGVDPRLTLLRFARDYSFRELKANNVVLLGNSRANPWVEPFESKLGLRWIYDKETGTYYPKDTWGGDETYRWEGPPDAREGYCAISLLPNLGSSGNVLIIAGTGGSAINAGEEFLADEGTMSALRRALPATRNHSFPPFEALIRVKGRSALPRDANVVVCRSPRE